MIKRLSIAGVAWVLVMSPAILHAGHHPRHTGTPAALWIFLGIIAFIGIIMWLARKRK